MSEWERRARSFGRVADLYDRYRPGYPDQLYVDILSMAPGRRVLEAGAGTGRATTALARRGASVLAIEPDPEMAEIARDRTRDLHVQVRQSSFEDCTVEAGAFDLVVSAQAWHWVDPDRGAAVAARALCPAGLLALWWNHAGRSTGATWDAIHAAYQEHAPELDQQAVLHELKSDDDAVLEQAAGFEPWSVCHYDWPVVYDAESYGGLIQTHSDHQLLPAGQRERLVAAVRAAIHESGGQVEYHYRTVLLTARPTPS